MTATFGFSEIVSGFVLSFFFFGGVEVDAESRGGDALGLLIKSELFSMNGIQGFFLSIQYRLPPFPHLDVSVNLLFPRLLFPPL